jgi:hypothetical protein
VLTILIRLTILSELAILTGLARLTVLTMTSLEIPSWLAILSRLSRLTELSSLTSAGNTFWAGKIWKIFCVPYIRMFCKYCIIRSFRIVITDETTNQRSFCKITKNPVNILKLSRHFSAISTLLTLNLTAVGQSAHTFSKAYFSKNP